MQLLENVCEDARALLKNLEVLRQLAGPSQATGLLEGPGLLEHRGVESFSEDGYDVEVNFLPLAPRRQPDVHHGALPRWSKLSPANMSDLSLGSIKPDLSLRSLKGCLFFGGSVHGSEQESDAAESPSDLVPTDSNYSGSQRDGVGAGPPLDGRWRDLYLTNDHNDEDEAPEHMKARRGLGGKLSKLSSAEMNQVRQQSAHHNQYVVSPNGRLRLMWDLCGTILVIFDLITAPMYVGWDLASLSGRAGEQAIFVLSVCYWLCDISWSFNTAFVRIDGSLELSRCAIAAHYIRSWVLFDLFLIVVDLLRLMYHPFGHSFILREMRALRVLRAVRLFKTSHLGTSAEELLTKFNLQWVLLLANILRTGSWIFFLAHFCACFWYWIGAWATRQGMPSWMDQLREQGGDIDSVWFQYIRSMYWVLGNVTATNADNLLAANNQEERLFTCFLIFSSLFVMSMAVSNITNLFAELSRMDAEKTNTRRQLQQYLTAADMPVELTERVVRFALYSYARRSAVSLSPSVAGLLSERLRSEISRIQRSRYLLLHPLFALVEETHEQVFTHVCDVLVPRVYADSDIVFNAGTMAKNFYLTHDGTFKLQISDRYHTGGPSQLIYKEPSWFCEVSLFCKFVHRSTLQSLTFGDAFTLSTTDFMDCVKVSPTCIHSVYRYAEEFTERLVDGYQDDKHHNVSDFLPVALPTAAAKAVRAARNSSSELDQFHSTAELLEGDPAAFMAVLAEREVDPETVLTMLPLTFSELNEDTGVYVKLQQHDERKRVMAAILNAVWLLKDRYDCFTECQAPAGKLSEEAWEEWQAFVKWADLTPEMVHAMLVFLAIRGLGKVTTFTKLLPRNQRSPEDVVQFLMDDMASAVPSASFLGAEMRCLIHNTLRVLQVFNLPQLLQGENIPYHINLFREEIEHAGEQLQKFYLFSMVAVMCGLGGVQQRKGSSFMSERNSSHLLMVLHYMRQMMDLSPRLVYWGYITSRAKQLGLPTETQEQLVVARLCCLCRANAVDSKMLVTVWAGLSRGDRMILRRHFMANGLDETTFVFTFLPQYFANAKGNKAVGLDRAFLVLIDLLEALWEEDHAAQTGTRVVVVDLKDLAAYTMDVCSPRTFLATITQSTLVASAGEVHVVISNKHKQRIKQTGWADDLDMEHSMHLRKIKRKVYVMDAVMEELLNARTSDANDWTEELKSL